MKKRAIPAPNGDQIAFNTAVKENLEQIRGQRGGEIKDVSTSATNAELAAKINEILGVLQG